ncbi:hypothetical protein ACRRTK_017045 [Alexandromys fortis]
MKQRTDCARVHLTCDSHVPTIHFADVPGVGLSSSAQNIAPEAHKHKEAQTCSPRLREAFAFFLCLVTLYRNSKSESQGKTTACANGLDAEAGKRCGRGISGFSREESWWRGEARVRRQDQRLRALPVWLDCLVRKSPGSEVTRCWDDHQRPPVPSFHNSRCQTWSKALSCENRCRLSEQSSVDVGLLWSWESPGTLSRCTMSDESLDTRYSATDGHTHLAYSRDTVDVVCANAEKQRKPRT